MTDNPKTALTAFAFAGSGCPHPPGVVSQMDNLYY
jgi:hypothetical protein